MLHEVACMEAAHTKTYLIARTLTINWSNQSPGNNKWVIKQVQQYNHKNWSQYQ
jgi:hypothetical protein